jgi:DNA polymerase III delta subunit
MSFQSAYADFSGALRNLLGAVEEGRAASVYLFTGADEFLVTQSARRLAYQLVPEEKRALQLSLVTWDDEGRGALREFLASRSLFAAPAERSVLILSDPPTGPAQPDLEELLSLVQPGPPPGNVLILMVRQPLPERHPLRQLVSGLGVVVPVPELRTAGDRRDFIRRRLIHEHLRASTGVIQRLDWLVGNSSRAVAQEARKLALYLYPANTVTERDLDAVVSPTTEVRTYELADAIAKGDPTAVLALLRRMREAGAEPFNVINQLSRALRRMLQARLLLDRAAVDLAALQSGPDAFGRWLEKQGSAVAPLLPEDPAENLLTQNRYAVYRQFLGAQNVDADLLGGTLVALVRVEVLLKSSTFIVPWDAVTEIGLAAAGRVRAPVQDLSA